MKFGLLLLLVLTLHSEVHPHYTPTSRPPLLPSSTYLQPGTGTILLKCELNTATIICLQPKTTESTFSSILEQLESIKTTLQFLMGSHHLSTTTLLRTTSSTNNTRQPSSSTLRRNATADVSPVNHQEPEPNHRILQTHKYTSEQTPCLKHYYTPEHINLRRYQARQGYIHRKRHHAKSVHNLRPQQPAKALHTKLTQHQAKSTHTTERTRYHAKSVHYLHPQQLAKALHYSLPRLHAKETHTRLTQQLAKSTHTHTNTHHTESTIDLETPRISIKPQDPPIIINSKETSLHQTLINKV